MIKKLRIRFTALTMLALTLVLFLIMGAVNITNYYSIVTDADGMLTMLSFGGGRFPMDFGRGGVQDGAPKGKFTEETPFETRYFSVSLDADDEIVETDLGYIAAVDEDAAAELCAEVLKMGTERGFIGNYRYYVSEGAASNRSSEKLIVFLDISRDMQSAMSFLLTSVVVTILALLIMLVIVYFAAAKAVKPIAESYEKQRRFITDAGHELKTPIAIINADTEVLELDTGETEWTRDIKQQTKRLADLTADLIYLSRMEESDRSLTLIDFSFSDMVEDAAGSFVALAKTKNRTLDVAVQPMLEVKGDEKALRQVVGILLDNAIKYSPEGGNIGLRAEKGAKGVTLTVSNDAENVSKDTVSHMFDRFYRGDSSRSSENPGYGIGLSIAKAIIDSHKGKIAAEAKDGRVKITVTL